MAKYLGEVDVDWKEVPEFSNYTKTDWALLYIANYGWIDGSHHKQWLLDQVARILHDAPIKVKKASWSDGNFEYRHKVGSSKNYENWVQEIVIDEDGDVAIDYDEGIAP